MDVTTYRQDESERELPRRTTPVTAAADAFWAALRHTAAAHDGKVIYTEPWVAYVTRFERPVIGETMPALARVHASVVRKGEHVAWNVHVEAADVQTVPQQCVCHRPRCEPDAHEWTPGLVQLSGVSSGAVCMVCGTDIEAHYLMGL